MFRIWAVLLGTVSLAPSGCGKLAELGERGERGERDPLRTGLREFQNKDYDAAVASLTEVIRRRPADPGAYYLRGLAYFHLKEYAKAVEDQGEAIRQDESGDVSPYHIARGHAFCKLKRYEDALHDYEDAVQRTPNDGRVLNELAWFLATCPDDQFRNGQEALEHARRACELAPIPTHWDTLAAAHAELGNFTEAVQWQEKALVEPDEGIEQDLAGAKRRLQLYKHEKPFRDE